MTRPIVLSPTYNALTGNVSMANLDTTYAEVAAALNDLSNCSVYLVDTGAVNALAVNPAPATVNIDQGTTIDVLAGSTNTGPATLTIAGSTGQVGAITITDGQGNALSSGVLLGNTVYRMVYVGSVWRAAGTLSGGGVGPGAFTTLTATGATQLAATTITTATGVPLTINTAGGSANQGIVIQGPPAANVGMSIAGNVAGNFDLFQSTIGEAQILNRIATDMVFYTKNLERLRIQSTGGISLTAPDTVSDSLTINNPSGGAARAIVINGAVGIGKIAFNNNVTTGSGQAQLFSSTIAAINKPGGAIGIIKWIPVLYDGSLGYIPIWG